MSQPISSTSSPSVRPTTLPANDVPAETPITKANNSPESFFAKDHIERSSEHESFFAQNFQDNKRAPVAKSAAQSSGRALSVGELMQRQQVPEELSALTDALKNQQTFDTQTLKSSTELGVQLNVSFFDSPHISMDSIRDMLDNETQTRAELTKALSHLPRGDRSDAVDAVMGKLENKLCASVQAQMTREVESAANTAQARIAPFCGKDSTHRIKIMHGLVNSDLTVKQMQANLMSAGIEPSDAFDIAKDVLAVRNLGSSDAMHHALDAANSRGDLSAPQWEKGLLTDGTLRNIDEALQDAFEETYSDIGQLKEQVSSDGVRGDALFTNPLFLKAFAHACESHGIDPEKEGAGEVVKAHVKKQDFSDMFHKYGSIGIMTAVSVVATGGMLPGAASGATSSSVGLAVSQGDLDAAQGGLVAGTSGKDLVSSKTRARNVDAAMAVLSLVLPAASALKNADKGVDALAAAPALEQGVGASVKEAASSLGQALGAEALK